MLSAHWERRRTVLTELQEQLQSLPAFISELDAITANIGKETVSFPRKNKLTIMSGSGPR